MEDHQAPVADKPARRPPWNKGKLVGAKPPLRPSHVWSITTKLQMEGRKRDLALFNLAIGSKLRGCDVVAVYAGLTMAAGLSGGKGNCHVDVDFCSGSHRFLSWGGKVLWAERSPQARPREVGARAKRGKILGLGHRRR